MRYCVIMCGGIGSRFWPFSRNDMPKQFLDFFGTGKSLLQLTAERIAPLVPQERIIAVTNEQYAPLVREQLPLIPEENILCEPARRNTAPCLCWAARHIAAMDPDATIITLPSDHLILKQQAFLDAIAEGMDFVETHPALLTLGIEPTRPETGYGYIQRGQPTDFPGILKVRSFTEKPSPQMAKVLLASGDFYWNAGIFIWRAETILKAFSKFAPEVAEVFEKGEGFYGTTAEKAFIDETFPTAPNISIDYAVMEKADNVFVKTVDLGWSDLGTWGALHDVARHDESGNVVQGARVIAPGCEGSMFAVNGEKVIVAADLKDYIVAENGNALLIVPRSREQEIKSLLSEVRARFGDRFL